jgi:hypothetical protein
LPLLPTFFTFGHSRFVQGEGNAWWAIVNHSQRTIHGTAHGNNTSIQIERSIQKQIQKMDNTLGRLFMTMVTAYGMELTNGVTWLGTISIPLLAFLLLET